MHYTSILQGGLAKSTRTTKIYTFQSQATIEIWIYAKNYKEDKSSSINTCNESFLNAIDIQNMYEN